MDETVSMQSTEDSRSGQLTSGGPVCLWIDKAEKNLRHETSTGLRNVKQSCDTRTDFLKQSKELKTEMRVPSLNLK
jgi:hypothetical protein